MRVTIVRLLVAVLTLLLGLLLVYRSDGYKKQRMIEEIERRGYCTQ